MADVTTPQPYGERPPIEDQSVFEYPSAPTAYDVPPGYPGYAGQPYGYPPPGYPPRRSTNGMAIAALVSSFVFPPLGIVLGHVSLSQLKKSDEDGKGLAVAGLAIGYVVTALAVVVIVASVLFTVAVVRWAEQFPTDYPDTYNRPGTTATAAPPNGSLPPFEPPATLGSNCQYPKTTEPASKPVAPPRTGKVPTTPPTVDATINTNRGVIGLQLDNQKAPCTVNNFTSLAQQGFYDATTCHRLTTSDELGVLQCGDPTGTGTGGPGYRFPNEYPTNQYRLTDPALNVPVVYPRGTLAMANAGPGTNGSQFFLVYRDSSLPPSYTAFGTIDQASLKVLDEIADGGVKDGGDDGAPAVDVTIRTVGVS